MKIRIHRGAQQIGGTCVEIESQGRRIALDLGLPLDGDLQNKTLVPDLDFGNVDLVAISHPHLDHYGLLHHIPSGVPVAMGDAARRIVTTAAPFTKQPLPSLAGPSLRDQQPLVVGPFRITPYLVDHSAFDAYALLIEADGKRIFYSGDFRGHGRKAALFERMVANPPGDIDVLLMEGSSLSRLGQDESFPSETDLEERIVWEVASHSGLVMVHASAQNIDRMVTLYRAAKRLKRTLIIDLYTAAILTATEHPSIPKADWENVALYVPHRQRLQIKQEGWFELLAQHAARRIYADDLPLLAPKAMVLFRPLHMADLEKAGAMTNARFIFSQWQGYLDDGGYASVQDWLKRHNIPIEYIHTSGHASPLDLKRFAHAMRPKKLVPIHSFSPELYESLFSDVVRHVDGEWWEA